MRYPFTLFWHISLHFLFFSFLQTLPKKKRAQGTESLNLNELFKPINDLQMLVKLQLGFVWQRARKACTTTLTNPYNNEEKSMHQFWQIYVTTSRNPSSNFDKCNNRNKIQNKHGVTEWLTDKTRLLSNLGPIKIAMIWIVSDRKVFEFDYFDVNVKSEDLLRKEVIIEYKRQSREAIWAR